MRLRTAGKPSLVPHTASFIVLLISGVCLTLYFDPSMAMVEYQGAAVPKNLNRLGAAGKPGAGSWLRADPQHQARALAEAEHDTERRQLDALKRAE